MKNKTKKILSILMCLCLILSTLAVSAVSVAAETSGDFKYKKLDDDTVEITGYIGEPTTLEIPAEIDGKSVTSIGDWAFSDCTSLTSVTIPNSVTSIGSSAFDSCTLLTSINVDESNSNYCDIDGVLFNKDKTTILAYPNGKATTYSLPDSVTSIGDRAFSNCTALKSVTIGNGVTSIGDRAFERCTSLTSITIPDSVTSIDYCAFEICTSLTSVTIGNSVTSIGIGAFRYCESLTSITIPNSVTSIGDNAFTLTALKSIIIPDSVTSIGSLAFQSCNSLTSITIGNGITGINNCTFYCCSSLTSVTIPDSVTSIGYEAFEGCSSLTNVTIPNSVTSIGSGAFSDCTSLKNITIPNSVTYIGSGAFSNTAFYNNKSNWQNNVLYISNYLLDATYYYYNDKTGVEIEYKVSGDYKIKDGTVFIADYAFSWCESLASITIPESVTSIGDSAFLGCTSLTNVTIPDSVTSIGKDTFCNCSSLTNVTIPDSVTSIDGGAFERCTSLTSITIPDSVTSIDYCAFQACTSLTSVTIPDSVTSIGHEAFWSCESLTSVTIGNGVTSIGDEAFYKCTSLTSVTIGNSVTSIGDRAFYDTGYYNNESNWDNNVLYIGNYLIDANSSGDYKIKDGTIVIADYAFNYCESLTSITIPESVTSIGKGTFKYCESLTSITIPESVTSIGDHAFYYCKSLTSVTIPDSVTNIYGGAFGDCTSLTSVTIPNSVTSIGDSAFRDCTSLISITIPNSVTSIGDWVFSDCNSNLTIYGYKNSEAEKYANNNSINFVDLENHTHAYTLTTTKQPTCTEKGVKKYTCSCGDSYTEEISALGHTEVIDKAVAPTCAETGLTEGKHCSVCDEVLVKQEVVSAKGHILSDWQIVKEPTTTETGLKQKVCTVCNEVIETVVLPKLDETHTHSYTPEITKQPTCTKKGIKTYTCSCGESYTEEISALGHKEVVDKAASPTCTEAGLTEGKHCSVCNEVLVAQEVIPSLGHKDAVDKAVSPTCTETGLTEGKHCSVCGEILVKQKSISTKAHSYKWVVTKKASYVSKGLKAYKCSVCGKVAKTTSIAKLKLKTPSLSVGAGKKMFKVKYTKVTGATGFQVKYTIGKKTVTKTINTAKSITKTISGLKKGSYKVQIRAFVKQNSKTAYSDWTKAKSVKVK
ncbi:MAG: leucine-rich repeat domain-containing protein [Acutalibacteraceae bacterium]|nr:leucine-rich repeat domain-containing protein [Acutalibacteraceae bacterium]